MTRTIRLQEILAAMAFVSAIAIVGAFVPSPVFNFEAQVVQPPSTCTRNSVSCLAAETYADNSDNSITCSSRRSFFMAAGVATASSILATTVVPATAVAEVDCFKDCFKNCQIIAPKDTDYCTQNCREYCAQGDRKDGLSGSVSSEGGETGILGTYTVVKGEDKPPQIKLPGLDFSSGKGKKLIGY